MRGIVFNVMQDVFEAEFGAAAWDAVLAHARVDGAYTALAAYGDAEFAKSRVGGCRRRPGLRG